MSGALVEVRRLKKYFDVEKGFLESLFSKHKKVVHAVDGISFSIQTGEAFGLVGESGSGKTTTGLLVLGLIKPTDGKVFFEGRDIFALKKKELQRLRQKMQVIFQDPTASLDPRMTIKDIISEPLKVHKVPNIADRVQEVMDRVGLTPLSTYLHRHPHELSGGQRQRVGIARALVLNPKFIVADEPVSMLDLSIQAEILNLLDDLKRELGLTYLFIAHDLATVKYLCDRIAVMYLGKIVELCKCQDLLRPPKHPYTEALIMAYPTINPKLKIKKGIIPGTEIPSSIDPPSGCRFHTRCPYAEPKCKKTEPELISIGKGHWIACHRFS